MRRESLERLVVARESAAETVSLLERRELQHPRVALSVEQAGKHAAELERWLDDVIFIVEAELRPRRG